MIGAGKAALELGDAQAAAGFFARADDVNSNSPLPQAGMGAVSVANGEPQAALAYFRRAQQLGLPLSNFACDRGLAYDLMGRQSRPRRTTGSLSTAAMPKKPVDVLRSALPSAVTGTAPSQMLAPLSGQGQFRRARGCAPSCLH